MPFENFYKDLDKNTGPGSIFLVLIVFLLAAYLFCVYMIGSIVLSADAEEGAHQSAAEQAERLRRVDALCTGLPRPEKFYFARREEPIFGESSTAVIYYYKSDRELDEIKPVFTIWFGENDWKPDPKNGYSFKKDRQTISIAQTSIYFDGNIQIYCAESAPISFSVYH